MTAFHAALLGPPVVTVDGRPLDVDTRKAVAVLAVLALDARTSRESLAALLWSESGNEQARSALRRTLSVLNRALGSRWLAGEDGWLELVGDDLDIDVHTVGALEEQRRQHGHPETEACDRCIPLLEEIVALHRGDLLEGFVLRDSPAFDDWLARHVEHVRRRLLRAIDLLVKALVHRGDLDQALAHARRVCELEPLDEPARRRLMLLLAWTGDRTAAIREYRDLVTVLDRELGVAPLAATADLYRAIVEDDAPPPPVSPPTPIPPAAPATGPATPFVGRDAPLRTVRAGMSGGSAVAVTGEAGIGKSRLLTEAAAGVERVVAVRCHAGEAGLAYAVVADLLRAMLAEEPAAFDELPPVWREEVARLLPELVATQPAAAPIDTPEGRQRLLEAIRQAVGVWSATTRSTPLAIVEDIHWADSASAEAVAYLTRRIADVPLCLALSWRPAELSSDHPIRRVECPTVTLERLDIAAIRALVAALRPDADDDLAQRLLDETGGSPLLLTTYLTLPAEAVPNSVREVLRARLTGVSEPARQVATTAAVIGRSFDIDTVLRASGRSEEETVAAIDELLAAGVIVEADDTSYDFSHDRLRDVVYDDASVARRRLLHGRVADALLLGGTAELEGAIAEHLRLAGRDDEAALAAARAGERARRLFANETARHHLETAIALGHPEQARLRVLLGEVETLLGDYRAAIATLEAAAAHTTAPDEVAAIELRIALVHERRGEWQVADVHLDNALGALGDDAGAALRPRLLAERSLVAHRLGRVDDARERARTAIASAESIGDDEARAQALNVLGILARSAGDPQAARAHHEASLHAASDIDDPTARIAALNNLALADAAAGDLPRALEHARQALQLCIERGDRHREAALENNLADLLHAAGESEAAMEHLKRAAALFADIGDATRSEPEIWKLVDW